MVSNKLDHRFSTWGLLAFSMGAAKCLLSGCIFYLFLREDKRMKKFFLFNASPNVHVIYNVQSINVIFSYAAITFGLKNCDLRMGFHCYTVCAKGFAV